jgi:hypothetical protein
MKLQSYRQLSLPFKEKIDLKSSAILSSFSDNQVCCDQSRILLENKYSYLFEET